MFYFQPSISRWEIALWETKTDLLFAMGVSTFKNKPLSFLPVTSPWNFEPSTVTILMSLFVFFVCALISPPLLFFIFLAVRAVYTQRNNSNIGVAHFNIFRLFI